MKTHILPILFSALCLTLESSQAATIAGVGTSLGASLGTNFFFNTAALGGGDFTVNQPNSATFLRNFGTLNVGAGGSTINISGIAWASFNNAAANDATSATVGITYLGANGSVGGGDDLLIGNVTDNFTFAGAANVYAWNFDTSLSATIDGLNNVFLIVVTPNNGSSAGSLSFKGATIANADNVKLSVAGTSVAVVPEPSTTLLGGFSLLCLLRRRR